MNLTSFVKRLFTVAPDASNPSAQVVHPPSGMPIGRATHHMDLTPSATPSILESPYAFLSYSHKNMQLVHQFAAYLSQEEIPPWVDNRLEYGESWEKMIFRRIESCKVFLVLTSSAARESDFVNREIDAALRLNKLIIPICLDDESFPELQTYQSVRLLDTDHPRSRFIERLRDLLTPGQVPSRQLQRRRVEHFVLPVFEEAFEVHQEVRVTLGVGFDRSFAVQPQQSLTGQLDEMNWIEIFITIRERLPQRDLHCPLGTDFDARFPTVQAFIDFLMDTLTWDEIRRL
jgi:hypothetical protein